MITTVTQPYREALLSASISTSTVNAMSEALFRSLGLFLIIALVFLLMLKEVLATVTHSRAEIMRRVIDVAVMPLTIAIVITAIVTISGYMRW